MAAGWLGLFILSILLQKKDGVMHEQSQKIILRLSVPVPQGNYGNVIIIPIILI